MTRLFLLYYFNQYDYFKFKEDIKRLYNISDEKHIDEKWNKLYQNFFYILELDGLVERIEERIKEENYKG